MSALFHYGILREWKFFWQVVRLRQLLQRLRNIPPQPNLLPEGEGTREQPARRRPTRGRTPKKPLEGADGPSVPDAAFPIE